MHLYMPLENDCQNIAVLCFRMTCIHILYGNCKVLHFSIVMKTVEVYRFSVEIESTIVQYVCALSRCLSLHSVTSQLRSWW